MPRCNKAVSGTITASRLAVVSFTVINMPGRKSASELSICARTVTARVTGLTREPTVRTVAAKDRPGNAALAAVSESPG